MEFLHVTVVIYCNCQGSSSFCSSWIFFPFYFGSAGTWLSAPAVLLNAVLFVFLSRLVSGTECGIRLYRFLIITFSFHRWVYLKKIDVLQKRQFSLVYLSYLPLLEIRVELNSWVMEFLHETSQWVYLKKWMCRKQGRQLCFSRRFI